MVEYRREDKKKKTLRRRMIAFAGPHDAVNVVGRVIAAGGSRDDSGRTVVPNSGRSG